KDRKDRAARIALEVMFPKDSDLEAAVSGECHLAFLMAKVLRLGGVDGLPGPLPPVPVGSVALDQDAAVWKAQVEDREIPSEVIPNRDAIGDSETEAPEYLGCFAFKLADRAAALEALDRSGARFSAGRLRIGLRIGPASLPGLLRGLTSIPFSGDHIGAINSALTSRVCTLPGAEVLSVPWSTDPGSCDVYDLATGSAFHLVACSVLLGARLVRARPRASQLPTVLQSNRIRVVDGSTGRAFSFDLLFHAPNLTRGGFMGKDWDGSGIAFDPDVWAALLRVIKPGGHLIAFGGSRTVHRIAVAIEDAGWTIRDTIQWVYWQGAPKSRWMSDDIEKLSEIDPAIRWKGWGTGLKPAHEPAVLARAPFEESTIARQVLATGTGALNIDGCRFPPGDKMWPGPNNDRLTSNHARGEDSDNGCLSFGGPKVSEQTVGQEIGRWPSNVVHVAKPSRREKEAGLDGHPTLTGAETVGRDEDSVGVRNMRAGAGRTAKDVRNTHATVKPVNLMRWLTRLVTPPGGTVLDPFMGSGTTGQACAAEGFGFVGIDLEVDHVRIAKGRIAYASPGKAIDAPSEADEGVEAPIQASLF
ncbi:MAG: site-specific DNA-methyltransferase, partial [Hyphomicrobiaceae bacterium]|nr:site-specific DNA-methyltransferase [Hyphomicrobiaceae bacterium]